MGGGRGRVLNYLILSGSGGGRVLVGATSRLGAYSNKYGTSLLV